MIGGGNPIASLFVRLGADITGFRSGMRRASGELKTQTQSMERNTGRFSGMMKMYFAVIGAAAIGAAVKAGRASIEFNEAMANVSTLIPGNIDRIRELKEEVSDLSIVVGKAAIDLSGGLYQSISAFQDTPDTMKRLGIAARMATAGVSSTRDALNLLIPLTKGYGDVSEEATKRAADLAFWTVKMGVTTIPELAQNMGMVTPIAKALGVELNELAALYATLTGATGNTSIVTTQLRGIYTAFLKPSDDMKKALRELGYESSREMLATMNLGDAMKLLSRHIGGTEEELVKLFQNRRALPAVFHLAGAGADDFRKKLLATNDALGAADEAYEEATKGINKYGHAIKQTNESMARHRRELGGKIVPAYSIVMSTADKASRSILNLYSSLGKLSVSGLVKVGKEAKNIFDILKIPEKKRQKIILDYIVGVKNLEELDNVNLDDQDIMLNYIIKIKNAEDLDKFYAGGDQTVAFNLNTDEGIRKLQEWYDSIERMGQTNLFPTGYPQFDELVDTVTEFEILYEKINDAKTSYSDLVKAEHEFASMIPGILANYEKIGEIDLDKFPEMQGVLNIYTYWQRIIKKIIDGLYGIEKIEGELDTNAEPIVKNHAAWADSIGRVKKGYEDVPSAIILNTEALGELESRARSASHTTTNFIRDFYEEFKAGAGVWDALGAAAERFFTELIFRSIQSRAYAWYLDYFSGVNKVTQAAGSIIGGGVGGGWDAGGGVSGSQVPGTELQNTQNIDYIIDVKNLEALDNVNLNDQRIALDYVIDVKNLETLDNVDIKNRRINLDYIIDVSGTERLDEYYHKSGELNVELGIDTASGLRDLREWYDAAERMGGINKDIALDYSVHISGGEKLDKYIPKDGKMQVELDIDTGKSMRALQDWYDTYTRTRQPVAFPKEHPVRSDTGGTVKEHDAFSDIIKGATAGFGNLVSVQQEYARAITDTIGNPNNVVLKVPEYKFSESAPIPTNRMPITNTEYGIGTRPEPGGVDIVINDHRTTADDLPEVKQSTIDGRRMIEITIENTWKSLHAQGRFDSALKRTNNVNRIPRVR